MTICDREKNTSQGVAICTQQAGHVTKGSDHIGPLANPDGDLVIVSWNDRYPNHVDMRIVTTGSNA